MITWRGERVVQLAKMILPGDIRHRAKLPHVADLGFAMRTGLVLQLPTIRKGAKGKWTLVTEYSKDVAAAHVLLQLPELRGREVSCSETEASLLDLSEQRHGERDERKLAALDEAIEKAKADILANPQHPPAATRGRRRSTTSEAVKQVARAAGLDERSLMRAHRRRNQGLEPEPVLPAEPSILDLGMPLSRDFLDKVCAVQGAVTAALDGVTRVRRAMQKLDALPYPKHAIVLADLDELSERLRKYWPFSLCPYCKGLSGIQEGCAACSMQGWIGKGQIDGVPDKLWDKVDRVVMVAGEKKRVADIIVTTGEELL